MPILSTEPATSVLWKALPWLSFLPSRAFASQQHPHCLQGQSWALFHVNPMQFSWQGSNTSSADGGTHHSFSLWGKAGEILGQPRATPEWRSSHCSSPALQPLPTCLFTTPVGESATTTRKSGSNPSMFTKEQWSSLEMLLLETSQAAILFSLPSHIPSTANSTFPRKTPHSSSTIPSLVSTLCSPPASQSGYTPSIPAMFQLFLLCIRPDIIISVNTPPDSPKTSAFQKISHSQFSAVPSG